jgi:hypothetical protein
VKQIREDGTIQVSLSPDKSGSGFRYYDSNPHGYVGIIREEGNHPGFSVVVSMYYSGFRYYDSDLHGGERII